SLLDRLGRRSRIINRHQSVHHRPLWIGDADLDCTRWRRCQLLRNGTDLKNIRTGKDLTRYGNVLAGGDSNLGVAVLDQFQLRIVLPRDADLPAIADNSVALTKPLVACPI